MYNHKNALQNVRPTIKVPRPSTAAATTSGTGNQRGNRSSTNHTDSGLKGSTSSINGIERIASLQMMAPTLKGFNESTFYQINHAAC
jgi:hypothetical protein